MLRIAQNIRKRSIKLNVPIVFRNRLCKKPNQFIYKYPNGKEYLVELNQSNSQETILREL